MRMSIGGLPDSLEEGVSQLLFVTVDNLSAGSTKFSVTIQYSPLCQ
jgi:hypothetical protein